jgi:hypothetical protein
MIKPLQSHSQTPISSIGKRRPKGWTPARRVRQAALIRFWQPWRRSTGPRSEPGKARSAANALAHGQRSRANLLRLRRIRYALRLAARNIAALRAHMRAVALRDAHGGTTSGNGNRNWGNRFLVGGDVNSRSHSH